MDAIAPILFLLLLSVVCWVLVFKKSAREKMEKGAWRLYRLKSLEQKGGYDAMYLAGVLVMALAFTVAFFSA
ncbi:MAG: hypothetical protein ABJC05_02290 [Pyrinomonadaceae bacterium]